ncbi:MAG TPA: M56 family metallopeptidase [Gemmatimonadales bacterium]|nr:M56 family metallopeptidase [Gemmatimonadales bacterium]
MNVPFDLLKVALLAGAGWVVATALRRRPATTRHDLWLLVVLGSVLVPVTELMLPRFYFGIPASFAPLEAAGGQWLPVVFGLWALWALVSAARVSVGLLELRRIARQGERWSNPELDRALAHAARLAGVTRAVTLVRSDAVQIPATWGVRRPVVALPAAAVGWSPERLRLVLLHELVHVRRQDALVEGVVWLASALYWFHPALWLATRRLRLERERACDEAVLATGARASDYCGHLIDIMRAATTRARGAVVGAAMAAPCTLEHRVRAMLARPLPQASHMAPRTDGQGDRSRTPRSGLGTPLLLAGAAAIYALGALAPCAFVGDEAGARQTTSGTAP